MSDDEKVCLTAVQIENIGKAYARDIEGKKVKKVCPKASHWVKGFFKKGKKKKEPKDPLESWVNRRILNKIESWADGFF